jgi:pimeloyl-ACP methyl ester carboxylesterase
MNPASHYLRCAGREIHYVEWGAEHAETVIAWHGLARTCRDMDDIAAHLAQRYRADLPRHDRPRAEPMEPRAGTEYCFAFYEQLAVSLVDQLGLAQFHWLGTSMGGAIARALRRAACTDASSVWC